MCFQQGDELRPCKSRSVVHKSLEDNYGAVVVANHEALTQLLEQVCHTSVLLLQCRKHANSTFTMFFYR